jgi:hypothetical protein
MKTGKTFRLGIFTGLLIFGQMICFGSQAKEYHFHRMPLARAFQVIGADFGTTIIADPNLAGQANGYFTASCVEEVLGAILAPLGYGYTKVDDFYLVNNSDTPFKTGTMDSAVIHFGFINPEQQNGFREFQKYMVYDEKTGIAFIKAPTGIMTKILAKIREQIPENGPSLVAYSFQIMDLTADRDFTIGLQGIIGDGSLDDATATITPGSMVFETVQNRLKLEGNLALTSNQNRYLGRPWFLAALGKETRLVSLLHYPGDDLGRDRQFELKLTPVQIDTATGRVATEIFLEYNRDQVGKLATTLQTVPDQYQLIAILRRRDHLPEHGLTQKKAWVRERDFAVLMAAMPVNGNAAPLATAKQLSLGAQLDGFGEFTENHDVKKGSDFELEFGVQGAGNVLSTPWIRCKIPLGTTADMNLHYRNNGDYTFGLTGYWDETRETTFELLAGNHIGFEDKPLIALGLGDNYQPFQFLTLFGKYYPVVYQLDSGQFSDVGLWEGGLRLGSSQISLSANFFGDPNPSKTWISFDAWYKNVGFSLGAVQEYASPNHSFRVGLKFKL